MKRMLLFTVGLIASLALGGQVPEFEWAGQFHVTEPGPSHRCINNDVDIDMLGNVYLTGHFDGTVDFDPSPGIYNLSSLDDASLFVVKLNPLGQLLWAYAVGSYEGMEGSSIETDSIGNVYISGTIEGLADFDPGSGTATISSDDSQMFVLKLTTNGDFVWVRSIEGADWSVGWKLALDHENIYATGEFIGNADFDSGLAEYELSSLGGTDVFIWKLDYDGDFLWAGAIGGGGPELGNSIAIGNNGELYLAGYFESSTIDVDPGTDYIELTRVGIRDVFLVKLNESGVFQWGRQYGVDSVRVVTYGLVVDHAGNLSCYGFSEDRLDMDPGDDESVIPNEYSQHFFLSKLTPEGNLICDHAIATCWALAGAAIYPSGNLVKTDKANNIYFKASFKDSVDSDPWNSGGNYYGEDSGLLLKLDSTCSLIWTELVETPSSLSGAIELDSWGNIFTTGSFTDTIDLDPGAAVYQLATGNNSDGFIQKLRQIACTSDAVSITSNNTVTICPGDTIILYAELSDTIFVFEYDWNTGASSASLTVSPASNTAYSVEVYHAPACYSRDTFLVEVFLLMDSTYAQATSCDTTVIGTQTIHYADQNGCDSIVLFTTDLTPLPDVPILPANNLVLIENAPPFNVMIAEVPGAVSYAWQVPPGVQILAGQGSTEVSIDWSGMTMAGSVCVQAIDSCGRVGEMACMEVIVDVMNATHSPETSAFTIYPNPAKEYWLIRTEAVQEVIEITLFDALGRIFIQEIFREKEYTISTKGLVSGTYWLKLTDESGHSHREQLILLESNQ